MIRPLPRGMRNTMLNQAKFANGNQNGFLKPPVLPNPVLKDEMKELQPWAEARKLVQLAQKEIGVVESGGNNCGPKVKEYLSATWLEPGPWAWCAAFICWCVREWQREISSLPKFERPRTASAFDLINWAKKQGLLVLPEEAVVCASDLVIFDFSHCGIVSEDDDGTDFIKTIEGNTNKKGDRDSESGDGVWEKKRSRSLVRSYIRWRHVNG